MNVLAITLQSFRFTEIWLLRKNSASFFTHVIRLQKTTINNSPINNMNRAHQALRLLRCRETALVVTSAPVIVVLVIVSLLLPSQTAGPQAERAYNDPIQPVRSMYLCLCLKIYFIKLSQTKISKSFFTELSFLHLHSQHKKYNFLQPIHSKQLKWICSCSDTASRYSKYFYDMLKNRCLQYPHYRWLNQLFSKQ